MDREFQPDGSSTAGASAGQGSSAAAMATWLEALCAVQQAGAERVHAPIRLHFPNEKAATSFHDRLRAAV